MNKNLKILYVDLGGVAIYSMDKTAGRILGWAEEQNDVFLLAPKLIEATAQKEICGISRFSERIKIIALPFSGKARATGAGIIFSYFLRILFSPWVLFKNIPKLDIGYSNSPVLVDIVPILLLKIFGKCKHWILMFDSVVPEPAKRSGDNFVNSIAYLESRLVIRLAKFFASAVFTVNPELKYEIIKNGVNEKKVFLTQNGLFMNRIDNVLGRERNQYDAVYMGRITENKGIFDLLQVWSKIIETVSGAKLAILGTGREEVVASFIGKIKEKKLEKNVEYLGYVCGDKKYEIFKSSKIFIYLSKINADESWGISLMEALACGLPSFVCDLGVFRHIYGDNVIYNKVGDIESIADKAIFLLNNKKECQVLSEKSAIFAKQYDWFKIAGEDLSKIKEIIKT